MASSKPKSSKPKSRTRGKGKPQGPQTHQIQVNLTLDQKLDILGILLVAVGGITVLSLLPSTKSDFTRWWLDGLSSIFGGGVFIVPLALIAVGIWLLLRRFDQVPKPS